MKVSITAAIAVIALLFAGIFAESANAKGGRGSSKGFRAPQQRMATKPIPQHKQALRFAPKKATGPTISQQKIPNQPSNAQKAKPQARPTTKPKPAVSQAKVTKDVSDPKRSPSETKEYTHPSGRRDVYTSNKRNANGSIGNPHSHTVLNKARQVEFARTTDGKVIKNSGNHVPRSVPEKPKRALRPVQAGMDRKQ